MLKTIKTTKHMRLDELIKYVWDKGIVNETMTTTGGLSVSFWENGVFETKHPITSYDLFPIETEEEITEDTKFHILVGVYFLEEIESYDSITFYNRSIDDVKDHDAECIYALIDNKLELIWERE